jgi:hypothetical protein
VGRFHLVVIAPKIKQQEELYYFLTKELVMKTQPVKALFFLFALPFLFLSEPVNAATFNQVVRGTITDRDTKQPIIGANVVLVNRNPIIGASTNENGEFRLENIKTGRITLCVTCLGYEKLTVPNIQVISGKECVLNSKWPNRSKPWRNKSEWSQRKRGEVLNEMAIISARAFTVMKPSVCRFTRRSLTNGSAFAGVTTDPAGLTKLWSGAIALKDSMAPRRP